MKKLLCWATFMWATSYASAVPCALNVMEPQLMQMYGLSPINARAYRSAVENFLVNLELTGFTLTKPVNQVNLAEIRKQCVEEYGFTEDQAGLFLASINLVQQTFNSYGILPDNPSCLGLR